jgi:hypothetical protein
VLVKNIDLYIPAYGADFEINSHLSGKMVHFVDLRAIYRVGRTPDAYLEPKHA